MLCCRVMRSLHSIRAGDGRDARAAGGTDALDASAQQRHRRRRRCRKRARSRSRSFCAARRSAPNRSRSPAPPTAGPLRAPGGLGAPLDIVARRVQVRYTADWRPLELTLDATVRGQAQTIRTTVEGTTATSSDQHRGGQTTREDRHHRRGRAADPAKQLLRPVRGARRAAEDGGAPAPTIPVYSVPQVSFTVRVGESTPEQIQTTARSDRRAPDPRHARAARRACSRCRLWADETGRMIRFSVPAQSLEVVREDIAAVSSRTRDHLAAERRAGQHPEQRLLAGRHDVEAGAVGGGKLPAVVLVGGSGPTDRDGLAFGIPILGQTGRRARRRRLHRRPLRQARHRSERRARRIGRR